MKLSNKEQQEVNYLREFRQGYVPMTQEMHSRLTHLNKKEFHNCCSNPCCTGYEGTEQETNCPKCKSNLHKTIWALANEAQRPV